MNLENKLFLLIHWSACEWWDYLSKPCNFSSDEVWGKMLAVSRKPRDLDGNIKQPI